MDTSKIKAKINLNFTIKMDKYLTDNPQQLIILGNNNTKAKLDIGKICNARCGFCYYLDRVTDTKTIPLVFAKEQVKYLKSKGITEIELSGGEPLLYKNLLSLLRFIKDSGLKTSIVTNLSKPELAHKAIVDRVLDGILISLHGDEFTHNTIVKLKTYKKIIEFIENYYKKLPIRINTVIPASGKNLEKLKEQLFPFLLSGKIKQWNLLPLNHWDYAKNKQPTSDEVNQSKTALINLLDSWEKFKTKDVYTTEDIPKLLLAKSSWGLPKLEKTDFKYTRAHDWNVAYPSGFYREEIITVRYMSYCFFPTRLHKYIRTHLHHLIDVNDWNTLYYPEDVDFQNLQTIDTIYPNPPKASLNGNQIKKEQIKKALSNRSVSHYKDKNCLNCSKRYICDGFKHSHETLIKDLKLNIKEGRTNSIVTLDPRYQEL